MLWINLLGTYRDIEAKTVHDLETHLTNLSEALQLQTDSVLRGVDSVAIRLRREFQTRERQQFESDSQGYINNAMAGFAIQAVIVDRRGMLVWSSEAANYPMDLNDRDYFKAHAGNPDADALFIGKPILNRINQRWIIPLSRPLPDFRSGSAHPGFDGVVMISLDPRHFAHLLQQVDLGKQGIIAIVSSDNGSYLVRSSQEERWLGRQVQKDSPFMVPGAPKKGVFRQRDATEGVERLYAYQHLPEYGITLLAGLDIGASLAPIHERARTSYALALVVSVAIIILVFYLFLLLRRHGETEAELEAEHRILRDAERIGQVGSWHWDLDRNRLTGSEQLHRLFCFEESWGLIPAENFQERIHPEDRERVRDTLKEARRHGTPLRNLEYRIVCPDGSTRTVLACGEPLETAQGRQMIGTLLDITALRASQKQLLQAQIVFDNAQEAVLVSD
ncbi:PAS domain-containing protein, partial [Azovibrio restrictus]|uniref:PAS domain-containing protein n=1 Tax=Azovibrio restrictus TaxID=146938 RepID=UPI0026F1E550